MKIPSSASVILATLAISSSSSTLAAPAADASHDNGGGMSSSSSIHRLAASRRDSTAARGLRGADMGVNSRRSSFCTSRYILPILSLHSRAPTKIKTYTLFSQLTRTQPRISKPPVISSVSVLSSRPCPLSGPFSAHFSQPSVSDQTGPLVPPLTLNPSIQ